MKLSKIIKSITNVHVSDCDITSITLDSRLAKEGFLFCAVKGHNLDARQFINNTLSNNVSAVLADSDLSEDYLEIKDGVQIIYITNLNSKLSQIASTFYDNPSLKSQVIGVTGTNGKTTIAQLTSQWATLLGKKAASMGTIGNGFYDDLIPSENTTGSPINIQENLNNYTTNKADLITLEVSSHGLIQNRIKSIDFNVVAFTNLTQDHLDYHHTMQEYFEAKKLLFTSFNAQYNVINIDDIWGQKLTDSIANKSSIIAISSKNNPSYISNYDHYIYAESIKYTNKGTLINIKSNYINASVNISLVGPFNVSNFLIALGCMVGAGYDINDLINSADKLTPVIGRMEVFKQVKMPTIIIDYAHTPDALEKALQACRIHCEGDLWCIFGCGGDRDVKKRPLMGRIAQENSDHIIITDDNPRSEDPSIIINDIKVGVNSLHPITTIHDRFKALEYAFENSKENDIILVAGKGHEDYQIIHGKTIQCSDRDNAIEILRLK